MQNFETNDTIIATGTACHTFYIIMEGSVNASAGNRNYVLKKGDIVGVFDITLPVHLFSYTAKESCALIPYSFDTLRDFLAILKDNSQLCKLFVLSLSKNIYEIIRDYETSYENYQAFRKYIMETHHLYQSTCRSLGLLCKVLPFMENLSDLPSGEKLSFWMNDYFLSMTKLVSETTQELSPEFVYGFLFQSIQNIEHMIVMNEKLTEYYAELSSYLLNEDYLDFFDLFCDLFFRAKSNGMDATMIDNTIKDIVARLRNIQYIDTSLVVKRVTAFQQKAKSARESQKETATDSKLDAELSNSLNIILDYADTMRITAAEFKKYIELFKQLPDKNATDKESDSIRKQLTRLFYLIYNEAFQISLKSDTTPVVVKMFLNFGFLEPSLCGYENAVALYKIAENYHGIKEQGIYTIYEWIREIYLGNKQPSRNEFEQDYSAFVRSLRKEGKIDKETEQNMTVDTVGKVMYELQNMFPSVNKITFGRIFTFCPILLEENICKPLEELLLTPQKILTTLERLTAIDYSAFYHDYLYEETALNAKENVKLDIRPDIILMPNIGNKGILWQEIEGMRRDTPGRMMISALHVENVEKTFIRMIGEFRWEMCKRTQGARWNDISSHSLTSDYCDYAQFFQKNRDLSYEAKEKIKANLKHAKNSYREMFLMDYMTYMLYESTGSCRLTKVCRAILFRYCPFGKNVRDAIRNNTIFTDCLDKHRLHTAQTVHHLNQLTMKYQNAGVLLPDIIAKQQELIER